MVFSSNIFLFLFLPFTLAVYFLLRNELRNVFLLVMSLLFYAWGEPRVVFVMIASILVNYLGGLLLYWVKRRPGGKALRVLSLVLVVGINLGILFYYKYFDFFLESVNGIFSTNIPLRNIALPIGISFFTFQGMSYVLDLYMDNVPVQKNPLNIALYISMFPQLIAGPIVRYIDVNEQIVRRDVTVDKFAEGIWRFAVGLSKKAVLANNMGLVADNIFALPVGELLTANAWLGVLCYAFQIYFDFSGYSDMAIGLGKMFGFDFLENFNYPYISKSVTEFWRRWHISLSTWFRDYLYIPLGGNRRGNVYVNLLIVFFTTGLWHGASLNFIVWGLWHGLFLIIERLLKKKNVLQRIPAPLQWAYTMLVVLVGWVLFRAPDLPAALAYLGRMFGMGGTGPFTITLFWYLTPKIAIVLLLCAVASVPWRQTLSGRLGFVTTPAFRAVASVALMAVALFFVMTSTYNPFIYFRF